MWKDRAVLLIVALLGVGLLLGSVYIALRPGDVYADNGRNGQGRTGVASSGGYRRGDTLLENVPSADGRGVFGGGQGRYSENLNLEWATIEGVVQDFSLADGAEFVVRTADGNDVAVGGGQASFWTEQGYSLTNGEPVSVEGYEEDGEFKAARITRSDSGEIIALRDEYGRPLWSGRGRRQTA